LKISEDSEDFQEFYESHELLVKFISNIYKISFSNVNYHSLSKLSQNLVKFTTLLTVKIERFLCSVKESYPFLLLKLFNEILCVLLEVQKFQFIEDFKVINEKGLHLIDLIISSNNFQNNRAFNNIRNILIYNYLVFLSSDRLNISSALFKETTENLLNNIFDLCDQCNIDSYAIFFRFVEKLYIPYILNKIDENKSCDFEEIQKFMKVCRNNLVENCRWTFRYKEVNNLMGFLLNEQFFLNENLIKSKILNKFILESWEVGSKYWLIQRSIVDHLFKIFYKFPEIMHNFYDVIIYLLKSKENRGFDANLLFYLDECYIPVLNKLLNFFYSVNFL